IEVFGAPEQQLDPLDHSILVERIGRDRGGHTEQTRERMHREQTSRPERAPPGLCSQGRCARRVIPDPRPSSGAIIEGGTLSWQILIRCHIFSYMAFNAD